ncbi:MAG: hypothetical protein HY690_16755 [Chloroflexi bacterium]|nr:hypothetical protein [Chloroflexota bacterium]
MRLAVKNKEAPGFCSSFADMSSLGRELLEGSSPLARILVVMGSETPSHPLLKGVPAAETLARTEEAKALLKAVHAPFLINITHAVAPEVPSDRVQALRRARDRAYADPEFLAAAEKAQLTLSPKTGEEVTRIAQAVLSTPPAMLAKLRQVLE